MTQVQKFLILSLRIAIGWIFLYAAYQQITDPDWSAAAFLGQTRTAHDFFTWFAAPSQVLITDFLVKWGHLFIGLSLIFGFMMGLSGSLAAVLMFAYYLGHLDFPFVEDQSNFLVDFHLIYVGILCYLIAARASYFYGLDGLMQRSSFNQSTVLRWALE